jgi:hypothetical protein
MSGWRCRSIRSASMTPSLSENEPCERRLTELLLVSPERTLKILFEVVGHKYNRAT